MKFQTLALVFLLVPTIYLIADFTLTWLTEVGKKDIYHYNKRDIYFVTFFIAPAIASHLVTIWGHYYRADAVFQKSIAMVSTTNANEKKRISIWERHDPWLGYTYRYWVLVAVASALNLIWFAQPLVAYLPSMTENLGVYGAVTAYVAYGTGYAAMGACGMLLLLVLRRSMLQAIGYTYADLLPLHRGMGLAFLYWTSIHAVCYILYYVHFDAFWLKFNFDGRTRGPQNMIALGTFVALWVLFYTSQPRFRRGNYLLFITVHRIFTVIVFVGTVMHFPYYMIWYYVLPSMCLYLADRFVPKFMQACSIAPEVYYSFNKEADILTAVLVSRNNLEPLKPYYPEDYVNLEIPQISAIPHPFTIASYWAEDPYSMTIYIRTFQENEASWTGALARLCSESEEPLSLKTKVDGVFGDRNHDYLSSKVMVIFAAGAAITTFMSLLKAIAAQIEAAAETKLKQVPIEVYLICTFRYESELYAYGDFMHRITHDPRFTSWLHTEVYVSRPDKFSPPEECPSGQCTSEFVCGRVEPEVDESTSLLASGKSKYGSVSIGCSGCEDRKGCCVESSKDVYSNTCGSSSSSSTIEVSVDTILACPPNLPRTATNVSDAASPYRYKSIPTFTEALSTKISTVHAKKDLAATALILVVPMIVFIWSRAIPWEGTYKGEQHWCRTSWEKSQHMTNRCLWPYALLPGILHIVAASLMGYLGLWAVRRTNLLSRPSSPKRSSSDLTSGGDTRAATDAYKSLVHGLSFLGPAPLVCPLSTNGRKHSDAIMPKGSIKFKRGRIQVNQHIQGLKELGIGCERDQSKSDNDDGGVIVFGGGPEAFVDMIHDCCKKSNWVVDFHRETWAP
ncbi:hypothetical protein BGZ79_000200 [Entomortierella chlamydospora]|nr:hypothetical protein BGZ79_000200 [Entomortierella chlamydospora]